MLLRPLRDHLLIGTTSVIIIMTMRLQHAYGKPQDPNIIENMATQALSAAGNMGEMVGNAGMIAKEMEFDMPFAKANSETLIGTGAALRDNNDDDSDSDSDSDSDGDSDDDGDSKQQRHKRSVALQTIANSLIGEESMLALPSLREHLHRHRRSPCHHGGGTGGGAGDNNAGDAGDDDDIDAAERRRRAYARRRKAAASKRAKTNTNTNRKRKLLNDDDDDNDDKEVIWALMRRKRQSELDDLNETTSNSGNKFSQQAQQIAEKLRNIWEGIVNSMNDMAKEIKQHFTDNNSTNAMEI